MPLWTPTAPVVSQFPPNQPASGTWLVPYTSGPSTLTLINNEVYWCAVDIPKAQTFTGIAVSLSTLAVTAGTCVALMGYYLDNGKLTAPAGTEQSGLSTTSDLTAGGGAVGDRYTAFASAITFPPGRYWLAVRMQSAGGTPSVAPVIIRGGGPTVSPASTLTATAASGGYVQTGATGTPLPTAVPVFTAGELPYIGLKAQ